jgi:hypothetical protein
MKLELELNEIGYGRVVLDGRDISDEVAGIVLRAHVGQLTRLRIEYAKASARIVAPVEGVRS